MQSFGYGSLVPSKVIRGATASTRALRWTCSANQFDPTLGLFPNPYFPKFALQVA